MISSLTHHCRFTRLSLRNRPRRQYYAVKAHQDYSIFDPIDVPRRAEQSKAKELAVFTKNGGYIELNQRIISTAYSTLDEMDAANLDQRAKQEAALRLIRMYESILRKHPMNAVNCVTMIHRMGTVFSKLEKSDLVFEECNKTLAYMAVLIGQVHTELDSRQISNMIWAFGYMGRRILSVQHDQMSFSTLYSLLMKRIRQLEFNKPQEISTIVCGLARMKFKSTTCKEVVDQLTAQGATIIDDFSPQEVANTLWGLANFRYAPDNGFIEASVDYMTNKLDDFTPKQISNAVWSYARLSYLKIPTPLLMKMEEYFVREIWEFTDHGISLVMWSFAKLRYLPNSSTLANAIYVIDHRLSMFSNLALTSVMYALATFSYIPPEVSLDQMKKKISETKSKMPRQQLCLFLWSLTMMFKSDLEFFKEIVGEINRQGWMKLNEAERRQLYQCMVHAECFIEGGSEALSELSPELIHACQRAWEASQKSRMRDTVCLAAMMVLQKMGCIVQSDYFVDMGLCRLTVDLAWRPSESRKFAVQVTTGHHRFRNNRARISGPMKWACRLKSKKGFEVLVIDAEVWRNAEQSERVKFLEEKMMGTGTETI